VERNSDSVEPNSEELNSSIEEVNCGTSMPLLAPAAAAAARKREDGWDGLGQVAVAAAAATLAYTQQSVWLALLVLPLLFWPPLPLLMLWTTWAGLLLLALATVLVSLLAVVPAQMLPGMPWNEKVRPDIALGRRIIHVRLTDV
jgi:hypothetical protein